MRWALFSFNLIVAAIMFAFFVADRNPLSVILGLLCVAAAIWSLGRKGGAR